MQSQTSARWTAALYKPEQGPLNGAREPAAWLRGTQTLTLSNHTAKEATTPPTHQMGSCVQPGTYLYT